MSDLHNLCLLSRPITADHISTLRSLLDQGIPATYTVEQAEAFANGTDELEATSNTTPLHLICSSVPEDLNDQETEVVKQMVDTLMEYGAGWNHADANNRTPGCVLVHRKLTHLPIYNQIVQAGVRAELLLRKVSEFDMEVLDDDEVDELERAKLESQQQEQEQEQEQEKERGQEGQDKQDEQSNHDDPVDAPSQNQTSYLNTKLEYTDDALVTADRKDGVMMAWETSLMELGSNALFSQAEPEATVLNIGFGMGIIDGFIQEKNPTKHYICEAHPDVLAKMKADGWFDKPNVVVLSGRWQDQLDNLLSEGVFFDGIYYDTFSEHYADMLELYDYVVGLLKPQGVFSFFNGLGADRQVVYDVYRELVDLDLANYGLTCSFTNVAVPESQLQTEGKSVWDDVKRSYWACPQYYHPTASFGVYEE